LAAFGHNLDGTLVGAVTKERVRVVLAVDSHASPAVDRGADTGNVNVAVSGDEMLAEDGSEELWRVDGVLLGEHVDGLFLSVCSDDWRVVCFGVAVTRELDCLLPNTKLDVCCNSRLFNVTLEKGADNHLGDMLHTVRLTTDFE
jgi:hypothetical protein